MRWLLVLLATILLLTAAIEPAIALERLEGQLTGQDVEDGEDGATLDARPLHEKVAPAPLEGVEQPSLSHDVVAAPARSKKPAPAIPQSPRPSTVLRN